VIFKNDLDRSCVNLPVDQRETVAVLTVAAPRYLAGQMGKTNYDVFKGVFEALES